MHLIKWKDETSNPDYRVFTAFINNRTVALASSMRLNKKNNFYSYRHSLLRELDVDSSIKFPTIEKCKEHTQQILDKLLDYAKTRQLVWTTPKDNQKQSYLIFENTNFALASIDIADDDTDFDDDSEDAASVGAEGYQAYLFLYSVDDVIYNDSYEKLKKDVHGRIQKALSKI